MKTLLERIETKIGFTDTGCWEFTGYRNPAGYGILAITEDRKVKYRKAHRVMYELAVGPVPDGLELDHLCCNKSCVNPDHLEAVTHRENVLRGSAPAALNARKTCCKHGHEFTPENTIKRSDGRECRACKKASR